MKVLTAQERYSICQLLTSTNIHFAGKLNDNTSENEKDNVGFAAVDEGLKPQNVTRSK